MMSRQRMMLQAFKWSALGELASRTIAPLSFLLLAKLLLPEEFGIAAAGTVVISFSQIFSDAGLGSALIQKQESHRKYANVAFWLNLALSITVALILVAAAPLIAAFFEQSKVADVIQVLAVKIPLAGLCSVHSALLQKNFNFRPLFWTRLGSVFVTALVSISLALMGASYWSLVIGAIAGQLAQVAALWWFSPWRPSYCFEIAVARQLMGFGIWLTAEGMLGWFYIWADSLMVGAALGTRTLGVYHTGNTLVLLVFSVLMAPLQPILFSAFSSLREKALIAMTLLRVQRGQFAVALPIGIGLYLLQTDVQGVIFGREWPEIGQVVGILGLMHGASWLMGSNPEAFKAVGRPDVFTKIMAIGLIYYLPSYAYALGHGLEYFLWVRLALFIASQPLHFFALSRIFGIGPVTVFGNVKDVIISAFLSVGLFLGMESLISVVTTDSVTLVRTALYAAVTCPFFFLIVRSEWQNWPRK
jgi:O-antigen/teichoic acid export membrane protein